MSTYLEVKSALKSVKVQFEGDLVYELKELTSKQQGIWMDKVASRMKFDENGKPAGYSSFGGIQNDLLSQCLYDSNGELATEDVLNGWPASTVDTLFEKAQEMSGLNQKGKDQLKNG